MFRQIDSLPENVVVGFQTITLLDIFVSRNAATLATH
jgi:hypothetical protein